MASFASCHCSLNLQRFHASVVFSQQLKLKLLSSTLISRGRRKCYPQICSRIVIDRRSFFNNLLLKQQEAEALEAEAETSCPIHCVREVYNCREFERILDDAQKQNRLVILDFHDRGMRGCKHIYHQFIDLCKMKGRGGNCSIDGEHNLIFVKHNIRDQYDELTDLARFYSIKAVPTFSVFYDGCRVQQFSTTNKSQIETSIFQLLEKFIS